jgi:hypothetical protein
LDGRPHVRRRRPARLARRWLAGTGEVEQVRAFCLVQTQRIRERVKDGFGGAAEVAPLEPVVYSMLRPASVATSSRRSPGTRRWPNDVIPTSSGVIRARLEVRKSRISVLMSTREA